MSERFDVAVAGSGPAGAACALRLARDGFSVALIDARPFPRGKLCGEYLNLGAIRELQDLGVADELRSRAQPLDGMRLYVHGENANFALPSEAWSIPRTVLDAHLREAALAAGATPLTGRVREVRNGNDAVHVAWTTPDGETHAIRARYLVGADGMHSTVARLCGLTIPVKERRFAVGAHYAGVGLGRWIEMYASPHEYVALNPVDENCANAVFVVRKERLAGAREHLGGELSAFSNEVTAGRRVLLESGFEGKRQAIGPLAHRTVRPVRERVLLAGDAAAFVDPFTGQGVYLALAGAREASAAIRAALRQASAQTQAWRDYAGALQRRIAERRRVAFMMKMMMTVRFAAHRAARALRSRPDDFVFLTEVVSGNINAASALELATAVGRALR